MALKGEFNPMKRILAMLGVLAIGLLAQDKPISFKDRPVNFTPPQVVYKIEAWYTNEARDKGIQGQVLLHLVVDRDGLPTSVQVLKPLDPGLDEIAINTVKQWRFKPATKDGQPVSCEAQIDINFALKKEPAGTAPTPQPRVWTPPLAQSEAHKPRVFVADSDSWQMVAGRNAAAGGARPQTAEILKTFGERCHGVIMTSRQDRADWIVTLDHEGGKGWARIDNKVAVFSKDGDMIYSGSTRSLGNAVKDACAAIATQPQK
jgi:TonB family protein